MKYKCPCCDYYTFEEKPNGNYTVCPVCFWEDDPIQFINADYEGGSNRFSLSQARQNFLDFGASDNKLRMHVRKPESDELFGIE